LTVDERLHYVKQDGRTVFKHAVTRMTEVLVQLLDQNGMTNEQIALFVPHQANKRIVDACAKRLGMDDSRVMLTLDRWANTTAGTIPTTFDLAVEDGRLKKGDFVVLATFGAGFTWGASLIRW
ncbi:MAG: 3-oxoacyl-[acyl-carrier-protein] synthase III C-terminal domain-containing protein, partial [Myxococcota bacterium]|nr:3-oxoacyl-[acyl-carrier-protein] synthase III C-terminal domain-containing protein [Myxococcota bacterium]